MYLRKKFHCTSPCHNLSKIDLLVHGAYVNVQAGAGACKITIYLFPLVKMETCRYSFLFFCLIMLMCAHLINEFWCSCHISTRNFLLFGLQVLCVIFYIYCYKYSNFISNFQHVYLIIYFKVLDQQKVLFLSYFYLLYVTCLCHELCCIFKFC